MTKPKLPMTAEKKLAAEETTQPPPEDPEKMEEEKEDLDLAAPDNGTEGKSAEKEDLHLEAPECGTERKYVEKMDLKLEARDGGTRGEYVEKEGLNLDARDGGVEGECVLKEDLVLEARDTGAEGECVENEVRPVEGAPVPAAGEPTAPSNGESTEPEPEQEPEAVCTPTSEPIGLCIDDISNTTISLKWRTPERVGAAQLEGYGVEYCKEGTDEWVPAFEGLIDRNSVVIKNLCTGDKLQFRVRAYNMAGPSPPARLAQAVSIQEIMQRPKIWIPRNLRQTLVKKVGESINLVIPFQGKPRPTVSWSRDGEPLKPTEVSLRNSDTDTILFIRMAERTHSGKYDLQVQIENVVDTASINIQIVDLPGSPQDLKITDVWSFNVAIEWKAPKDNGNCDIIGYLVRKADKKTMEWFTVFEQHRRTNCVVSDLVMGNEYVFQVLAINQVGLSPEPCNSKDSAYIEKAGSRYKSPNYKQHDFSEAAKFTHPLVSRSVIAGYNATLSCSVRGIPKPKVTWYKNKMDISNEAKYRMFSKQGVLTLEIRKPCTFDGGVYTCKAVNDSGEDVVECKLEVRSQIYKEEKKREEIKEKCGGSD